ncbi:MAG: hypothetical protein KJ950_16065 [Proteobacteria bacterium]|nr:hypothetical protein [Pseudomonadota bacterium]MBU1688863.1 hypothetical protein [Pseudomonadota bacterium]
MPKNPNRRAIKNSPLLIIFLLIFSISGAIYLNWGAMINALSDNVFQHERDTLHDQIAQLKQENKSLAEQQSFSSQDPSYISSPAIAPSAPIDLRRKTCTELDDKIQLFFTNLDQQEYIIDLHIEKGTYLYVKDIIGNLLANPPIVVRETDSLFTILTNTAHFYRVLGKEKILFLKDIITHESDSMEITLALFDQWSRSGADCQKSKTDILLPLQNLYEYAGFFLNTLGGQAYLFRRDSKLRLLIKYYSVMILDRANSAIMNRHGIDINAPLSSLIRELENSETLLYKDQYLRILDGLQDKYQAGLQGEDSTLLSRNDTHRSPLP